MRENDSWLLSHEILYLLLPSWKYNFSGISSLILPKVNAPIYTTAPKLTEHSIGHLNYVATPEKKAIKQIQMEK